MIRKSYVSFLSLVAVLSLGWTFSWSQSSSNPTGIQFNPSTLQTSANPTMLIASMALPNGNQQVIAIDSAAHSMAVYHVHPETGVITLKSVRKVDADFSLDEFNGADPSPAKVRGILGR